MPNITTPPVLKPLQLDQHGIFARMGDGAIINIGGVAGPFFTVGGRGLLFDDGSSTSSSNSGITLQTVYDSSLNEIGEAKIRLAAGKDLVIADYADGIFFKIDAETGKVTITGDLEILGAAVQIDTVIQDSDHWLISPKAAFTTALKIEPDAGVIPLVDLVTVRKTFGSAPVFRIDKDGNLVITGLINGVNIDDLKTAVDTHISGTGVHHSAVDIEISQILSIPTASNVQEALEAIDQRISSQSQSGETFGFEHIQTEAMSTWIITHSRNTRRATVAVYNDDWEQIIPASVKILDVNTVRVTFGADAVSGRAMLTLF